MARAHYATDEADVHVRFAGRSFDVPLATPDVGRVSSDGDVKRSVSVSPRADLPAVAVAAQVVATFITTAQRHSLTVTLRDLVVRAYEPPVES